MLSVFPEQRPWYVPSCPGDGAYNIYIAANQERVAHEVVAVGFLSHYLIVLNHIYLLLYNYK